LRLFGDFLFIIEISVNFFNHVLALMFVATRRFPLRWWYCVADAIIYLIRMFVLLGCTFITTKYIIWLLRSVVIYGTTAMKPLLIWRTDRYTQSFVDCVLLFGIFNVLFVLALYPKNHAIRFQLKKNLKKILFTLGTEHTKRHRKLFGQLDCYLRPAVN